MIADFQLRADIQFLFRHNTKHLKKKLLSMVESHGL